MMREVLLYMALAGCFCSQVWAQTESAKPEARVVFAGEMGKPGSQDIHALPGVRFGLEIVPEGAPKGTPVVLEARLLRPQDAEGLSPVRWLVAARMGAPVQIAWEFAYDWEVEPGVWTMKVYLEDRELTSVSFTVSRAASRPQAPKFLDTSEGRQTKSGKSPGQAQNSNEGAKAGGGENGGAIKKQEPQNASGTTIKQVPPVVVLNSPISKNIPAASTPSADAIDSTTKTSSGTPQAVPGKGESHDRKVSEHAKSGAPAPQNAQRVVGGKPDRRVYALMGGAYSEEARALRVASGLKARGVAPCLRVDIKNGKKLWHVVAGWRDSPEAARKAKAELLPVLGEVFVQPMSAGELETGLTCR